MQTLLPATNRPAKNIIHRWSCRSHGWLRSALVCPHRFWIKSRFLHISRNSHDNLSIGWYKTAVHSIIGTTYSLLITHSRHQQIQTRTSFTNARSTEARPDNTRRIKQKRSSYTHTQNKNATGEYKMKINRFWKSRFSSSKCTKLPILTKLAYLPLPYNQCHRYTTIQLNPPKSSLLSNTLSLDQSSHNRETRTLTIYYTIYKISGHELNYNLIGPMNRPLSCL